MGTNHYRASVESRAYELMTSASQTVLGNGDWSLVFENMNPESPIESADMSVLQNFGRLVVLGEMEGVADVPLPFSSEPPSAQLRMTGHFAGGTSSTEAILVYKDGRWLFSHFAYVPGSIAQ